LTVLLKKACTTRRDFFEDMFRFQRIWDTNKDTYFKRNEEKHVCPCFFHTQIDQEVGHLFPTTAPMDVMVRGAKGEKEMDRSSLPDNMSSDRRSLACTYSHEIY
jgi:5-methylcytosine-specific restriction endonuclease McrA